MKALREPGETANIAAAIVRRHLPDPHLQRGAHRLRLRTAGGDRTALSGRSPCGHL